MGAVGFGVLLVAIFLALELQTLVRTIYVIMGIIPELEIGIQTALEPSC
jgi:hypothetical protein